MIILPCSGGIPPNKRSSEATRSLGWEYPVDNASVRAYTTNAAICTPPSGVNWLYLNRLWQEMFFNTKEKHQSLFPYFTGEVWGGNEHSGILDPATRGSVQASGQWWPKYPERGDHLLRPHHVDQPRYQPEKKISRQTYGTHQASFNVTSGKMGFDWLILVMWHVIFLGRKNLIGWCPVTCRAQFVTKNLIGWLRFYDQSSHGIICVNPNCFAL